MTRVVPLSELSQVKHSKLHMSATDPPLYVCIERHRYDWTIGTTVYEIEVGLHKEDGIHTHKIITRYSMLEQLHQQLRRHNLGGVLLRDFPPKRYFLGRNDPLFLEEREKQLQAYLDNITLVPNILKFTEIIDFFDLTNS